MRLFYVGLPALNTCYRHAVRGYSEAAHAHVIAPDCIVNTVPDRQPLRICTYVCVIL
jgi:hypothetical protein